MTTFGQRKDRVTIRDNLATNPVFGYLNEVNLDNFGGLPRNRSGETTTKGVVLKPFRELSFLSNVAQNGTGLARSAAETTRGFYTYYNTSNSFQPADTA